MSLAVTWLLSMALTLLFLAMAVFTDHNDTWWNADLIWASGSAPYPVGGDSLVSRAYQQGFPH